MDENLFTNKIVVIFPQLEDEMFDEDTNSTFLKVICFKAFIQEAINKNDVDVYTKAFQFLANSFETMDDPLQNSVTLSLIAKLDFSKNQKAYSALSEKFKDDIKLLNQWHSTSNQKVNSFLKKHRLQ